MEIKFNCIVTGNQKEKIAEFTEWLDGDGWKHDYYAPLVTNGVFDHRELGDGWHGEIIRRPFTGLHDKTQQEIYDKDVLKLANEETVYVDFKKGQFLGIRKNGTHSLSSFYWIYAEKIGDIFQNPELLHNK